MMTPAANLPLEILHEIFNQVAISFGSLRDDKHPRQGMNTTETIPRNNDIYTSFHSKKIHEFAKYRLVSKQWKPVADAFLFDDIYITPTSARQPRNRGGRTFISAIIRNGYANVIRRLHVNLPFSEIVENFEDDVEVDMD